MHTRKKKEKKGKRGARERWTMSFLSEKQLEIVSSIRFA
jgi:hypothetical protein